MKGFVLIQTLTVIAILAILLGVSLSSFYSQSKSVSVERDAQNALAYLQKARNQTLSAVNSSSYGVRFTSTSTSLFQGTTYSATSTRSTFALSGGVTLTAALSGGATQLYFIRLSGEPSATGTITFRASTGSSSKTIIIRGTGLAEIQ